MKTTDIPNGYVILSGRGRNILIDFDDKGKCEDGYMEVALSGWPESIMKGGRVLANVLVLVHTVKGSKEMLIKRLAALNPVEGSGGTIMDLGRSGKLTKVAEGIWEDYMEVLMEQEAIEALKLNKGAR
jgi:hypothetical protein